MREFKVLTKKDSDRLPEQGNNLVPIVNWFLVGLFSI
jgi:hypothetical protein